MEQQQEKDKDFRKSLYWTNTCEHKKYDPVETKVWTECAVTQVFKSNERKIKNEKSSTLKSQ